MVNFLIIWATVICMSPFIAFSFGNELDDYKIAFLSALFWPFVTIYVAFRLMCCYINGKDML